VLFLYEKEADFLQPPIEEQIMHAVNERLPKPSPMEGWDGLKREGWDGLGEDIRPLSQEGWDL
jgi:hypothetical protein